MRCLFLTLRILLMSFALPRVKQSGHTHEPARSKLPRKLGNTGHEQEALPGPEPQLNRMPHSLQTSSSLVSPVARIFLPSL